MVVKQSLGTPDVLELHPMVRQFVRNKFPQTERAKLITAIIRVYERFIGHHRSELSERPTLSILERWTQSAELDVAAGKPTAAFQALQEVASAFHFSAYPREFCRSVRLLLSSVDWVSDHTKFEGFEKVFDVHVTLLGYLGEFEEADDLLEKYEKTVPEKGARYIHYCDMRCFTLWSRGDFSSAVDWGNIGQNLNKSGVDTAFDITHNLSLAQRDAGHPELALTSFLKGRPLSEVTDAEQLDEDRTGDYYGNIGRCLQFMGQIDAALACYQKSALLLERSEHVVNQGFARQWIGELLVGRGQQRLAAIFFRAARLRFQHVSPPRALQVMELAKQIESQTRAVEAAQDAEVEKVCRDWILGRSVDSEYR